jgi:hypothetical protein
MQELPPNVLVFITDLQRYDGVGYSGNPCCGPRTSIALRNAACTEVATT